MLKILGPLGFGLIGLAPASTAQEAPEWAGVWTAEPAWCAYAAKIGSHSPAPVRLRANSFEGYENTCEISYAARIGATAAWHLDLQCQSEGSTYDEVMLVIMEGPDQMWQIYQGIEPIRFDRCPDE